MVELRILGPLEIEGAAGVPRLDSYRQRAVLGLLALNADRVTSTESLIEAVWDGRPPATARAQIQICISALRRVLTENRCQMGIETRAPGYRLFLDTAVLDSARFDELLVEAATQEERENLPAALTALRTALGLWRGPVLADVPSESIQRIGYRLGERRMAAELSRFRIELALGRDLEVIPDLQAYIEEHPLWEDAYGYLMLALHRSGRSAEALAVYRKARTTLIQQVGLEPSGQLRGLEQAILEGGQTLPRSELFEPFRRAG
ncbi:AfsR/SARP family transcriptional regulator [Nocardia pseudobrasiliensis]|uniref:DNA-binding SARP family transcriptional activator n=1 Tax=Nocardia pseudobrasiliensis TaxID=45979 RepID=A0A370I092_9NOCA|nr:AfsR/SARP family transcriptional regulator [Nocardia pseudobrasiliensis]RDI64163.1 DNA-binding SARP family transcriptional activator [Nocardia pseudobrasiliensis]